jgi:hypothetical protein
VCLHPLLAWTLDEGGRPFYGNHRSTAAERASDVHSVGDAVNLRASLDDSKKENILLRSGMKSEPSFAYISRITGL